MIIMIQIKYFEINMKKYCLRIWDICEICFVTNGLSNKTILNKNDLNIIS